LAQDSGVAMLWERMKVMSELEVAVGLTNGSNTMFNVLIRTLHEHRLINKDLVSQTLLDVVREIKATPSRIPGIRRYDLEQFENLAKLLADPEPEPRWRPVVIQGGKDDPRDH
jgi:hypothetical protein